MDQGDPRHKLSQGVIIGTREHYIISQTIIFTQLGNASTKPKPQIKDLSYHISCKFLGPLGAL